MEQLQMSKNNTKGCLITFCGLDGCGKTTLIHILEKELTARGKNVVLTKQPTNAVRESEIFRAYMDSPDHSQFDYRSLSLLAASDRVQHCAQIIKPALEKGEIVISDRYFYSCLANLRARGFKDDKWIYEISQSIIDPDIAFFLDVPVEEAIRRVRTREEEKDRYIDEDLQYRLRNEYMSICTVNNGIFMSTKDTIEDLTKRIVDIVLKKLLEKEGGI